MIEEKSNYQLTASHSNSILSLQIKQRIISTKSNKNKKSINLSNRFISNVKGRFSSEKFKRSSILNMYNNFKNQKNQS